MDHISQYATSLDDEDRAHHEEEHGPGTYKTPNRYDISCTYRVPGYFVFATAYGGTGDNVAYQPGGTRFSAYGQCPGLFERRFGAIQSAVGRLRTRREVTKATLYPVNDHILRSHGRFEFRQGNNIRVGWKTMAHVRAMMDTIHAQDELLGMANKMCGIRVELRVAAATAVQARNCVRDHRLCDLKKLFFEAGQFQYIPRVGPIAEGDEPLEPIRFFPLAIMPKEIIAAYGFRITDAASKFLVGDNNNNTTRRQMRAQRDVYGTIGRTFPTWTVTTKRELTKEYGFWMFRVENGEDPDKPIQANPDVDGGFRAGGGFGGGRGGRAAGGGEVGEGGGGSGDVGETGGAYGPLPPLFRNIMREKVKIRQSRNKGMVSFTQIRDFGGKGRGQGRGFPNPDAVYSATWDLYGAHWPKYVALHGDEGPWWPPVGGIGLGGGSGGGGGKGNGGGGGSGSESGGGGGGGGGGGEGGGGGDGGGDGG